MIRYRYSFDSCPKRAALIAAGVVAAGLALLWVLSPTSWLPAWFTSVVGAVAILGALSVPRSIVVRDEALEIRCLVEITQIPYNRIADIRLAEWGEFRPFVPVFGSAGVMGWFGYWLQMREWSMIKVYATRRSGLVLIEDIYEERYLVSCDRASELVGEVRARL